MSCKIKNCSNLVYVIERRLCRKHYLRWWRHGSPTGKSDFVPPRGRAAANFKHGRWNHPLYGTWEKMIRRCTNPKDKAWKNYGGRGIAVCARWLDINNFIADMGRRPQGRTLDRIDNNRGYCPENCRWADNKTQGRNRRFAKLTKPIADQIRKEKRRGINGRGSGLTKAEIAEKYGVSIATIKKVISNAYWT